MHLAGAVPVRQVERDHLDAGKRVAERVDRRPGSCGTRCRRAGSARRARRVSPPSTVAGSSMPAGDGNTGGLERSDRRVRLDRACRPFPGAAARRPPARRASGRRCRSRPGSRDRARRRRPRRRPASRSAQNASCSLWAARRDRAPRASRRPPRPRRPRRVAGARAPARASPHIDGEPYAAWHHNRVRRDAILQQHGPQPFDAEHPHRHAGLARRAAEVRRQHDVLERDQAFLDRGLMLVHVERRAGDHARTQRLDERPLVDDRPARRVDEHRGRLHPGQPGRVEEMARLGRRRAVDADDVGAGEERVEIVVPPRERDRQPERLDEPRYLSADAPGADDEQALPVELTPSMNSSENSQGCPRGRSGRPPRSGAAAPESARSRARPSTG